MKRLNAVFKGSFPDLKKTPADSKPQFAFVGRSNVGKSSLINMLCDNRTMAKVSATPGKTITLNYFEIDSQWYLVDMPGYGYAQRSKTARQAWGKAQKEFLSQNEKLYCVFLLIDSRIAPQKIDLEQCTYLGKQGIPFCLLFTKADDAKQKETAKNVKAFMEKLADEWEELPPHIITSAEKKRGREDVIDFIQSALSAK